MPPFALVGIVKIFFSFSPTLEQFVFVLLVGLRHLRIFNLRRSASPCDPPSYIQYDYGLQSSQPIHICKNSKLPQPTPSRIPICHYLLM
jgi:hypothetical protein